MVLAACPTSTRPRPWQTKAAVREAGIPVQSATSPHRLGRKRQAQGGGPPAHPLTSGLPYGPADTAARAPRTHHGALTGTAHLGVTPAGTRARRCPRAEARTIPPTRFRHA